MIRARSALCVAVAALAFPSPNARAQGVPTVSLGKALTEHPEGLTQPGGARELRDGRLLVFDAKEQRLILLDFDSGEAKDVARQGSGPLEFRMIGGLLQAGDSILVPDFLQQRFLVLSPSGVPLGTRPILAKGSDMLALARVGAIVGIDARRRYYTEARGLKVEQGKMPTMSDTAALVRWTDFGVKGETLATRFEKSPMPKMEGSPEAGLRMRVTPVFFLPRDAWAVYPDGRVAVLRAADYSVRILDPAGKGGEHRRVPFSPQPITAKDKARAIRLTRETYEAGLKAGLSMAPSGTKVPKISLQVDEPTEWPKTKPPFTTATVAPDGMLWVLRGHEEQEEPIVYDLLDGGGRLVKRVRFPARTVVIGFGKGVVYATRRDEDDLRYVQRFKLP